MRYVLDTCVLVAALRSSNGASNQLVVLALQGEILLVISTALCLEYEDVLFRPAHKPDDWTTEDLSGFLSALIQVGEMVPIDFRYRPALDDPGDELVLEAAINGGASIVTFNTRHFSPAKRFGVRVYRPAELCSVLLEGGLLDGKK